jgi:hypothetical protein
MQKDFLTITPDSGGGSQEVTVHSLYHDNHFGGGVSLEP